MLSQTFPVLVMGAEGGGDRRDGSSASRLRWWLRGLSAIVVGALIALYWVWPDYRSFLLQAWTVVTSGDEKRIDQWVGSFDPWGPLVIVLLMVAQMFLIVVPSWLLMVIAVLGYGPWGGLLIAITAVMAASSVGYGVGHLIGRGGLDRFLGEGRKRAIERETERYGIWAVVVARINPLLSNDAISVVAGMVRMGFWRFLGATLGGIAPLAGAIAVFGRDWTQMRQGLIWLSLASLLGLGVRVFLDRRSKGSA